MWRLRVVLALGAVGCALCVVSGCSNKTSGATSTVQPPSAQAPGGAGAPYSRGGAPGGGAPGGYGAPGGAPGAPGGMPGGSGAPYGRR